MKLADFLNHTINTWDSGTCVATKMVALDFYEQDPQDYGNSCVKMGDSICEYMGVSSAWMELIFNLAPKRIKSQLVRDFEKGVNSIKVFCAARLLLQTGDEPSEKEIRALKLFVDKIAEISRRENLDLMRLRGSLKNEVEKGRTTYSISFVNDELAKELMDFAKNNEVLDKTLTLLAKRLRRIGRWSWSGFNAEDIFGENIVYEYRAAQLRQPN